MIKVRFFSLIVTLAGLLASCSLPSRVNPPNGSSSQTPTPSAEPTPTVTVSAGDQIWVEQTFAEESDSPNYEIQAVWPNLVGEPAQIVPFNERINGWVDGAKSDFMTALNAGIDEGQEQGEAPTSTLSIDYDLTAQRGRLFSTRLTVTSYIAIAAHPGTFSFSLNYDAEKGIFLTLDDLFLPGSDYLELIHSEVDSVLQGRGFDYQPGQAAMVMAERENWNLLPEGLRINFDAYEVAPYAAGPQYVLISWEDLAGAIDPEGPAAVFISD